MTYANAEFAADEAHRGAWRLCGGDFHRTKQGERGEREGAAKRFVRLYYERISYRHFRGAWAMLSARRSLAGWNK